jgi:hypothetical protein
MYLHSQLTDQMRLLTVDLDIINVDMNISAFSFAFMTGQKRHTGANIIHLGFPFFRIDCTMTVLNTMAR